MVTVNKKRKRDFSGALFIFFREFHFSSDFAFIQNVHGWLASYKIFSKMTRYFCMMLRKKDAKRRVRIRSSKPEFIRAKSGEFNFYIDVNRNHVSKSKFKLRKETFACHDAAPHIINFFHSFTNSNYLNYFAQNGEKRKTFSFQIFEGKVSINSF